MRVFITMLALALAAGCSQKQRVSAKAPSFQVRLVADAPAAGSQEMMFTRKQQDGSITQEVLHLQGPVLLSEAAVKATWIWKRGDVVGIDITLTDAGRRQLADLTRQNIGRRIAIIIDGRVRCAPKIVGEIDNGTFTVTSDWSLEEVDEVARRFDAGGAKRSH
jgi:preprotein translocase subunit SecD